MSSNFNTVNKVLADAADLIENTGFIQNDYWIIPSDQPEDPPQQYCMAGALYYTAQQDISPHGSDLQILGQIYRQKIRTIIERETEDWNDVKGRTGEEVIQALRQAAQVQTGYRKASAEPALNCARLGCPESFADGTERYDTEVGPLCVFCHEKLLVETGEHPMFQEKAVAA